MTADHLGTPRVITRADGSVSGRHDYQPFGEEIPTSYGGRAGNEGYPAGDSIRQQFTSKERDTETGLDYFLARYYSSPQGRFTSIDPLLSTGYPPTPQTWNRYSYTLNNPLRLVDPTGLALSGVGRERLGAEFDKIRYKSEFEAYMLSGAVRQVLEPGKTFALPGNTPVAERNQLPYTLGMVPLWNPSWATLDAAKIHQRRSWSVNSVLMTPKNQGGHYGLQPPKP